MSDGITDSRKKRKSKVFLGGTCNNSNWRSKLIEKLEINYFNPVVEDWTPECIEIENKEKTKYCDFHLYVITPRMTGVYSIAEAVESAILNPTGTVFCFLLKDQGLSWVQKWTYFTEFQLRSLDEVGKLIEKHGGMWLKDLDAVAKYLNKFK